MGKKTQLFKYKVSYETYGHKSLKDYKLKTKDEIIVETDMKDLCLYDAWVKILDKTMAPEGYESINDYYYKTGDQRGAERMVFRLPSIIAEIQSDLKSMSVELV